MAQNVRSAKRERTTLASQLKVGGIRRRWLINNIGAIILVLLLVLATLTIALRAFYYDSMSSNLRDQVSTTAYAFNRYKRTEYRSFAQRTVSEFENKSTLEIQFIETNGAVLYSSYGEINSGIVPGTQDVTQAMVTRAPYVWSGQDPRTGERIMAASAPVIYQGQSVVGVIRIVTSLREVDRQLFQTVAVLTLVGLVILCIVYFSNLYFVRSIIEPVESITETTRLIAGGSYGVQMEKQYDDEIGNLIETINDMSMKIMRSEKTQSEFISSVSHELRTPLTAINGWAETLKSGELSDPEDVRRGLDIILSEARRLTNMVEELLEFSRIEDGRFTLSVEKMDLKAELEDAVYTYREFFRREGISLSYFDKTEDEVYISGDSQRMRQVFCNLLDNAAKHGGAGKKIDVTFDVRQDYAEIIIRDYGAGVPEEELPHIKYKFYKGSSKTRGSGIGLAVCEEIITRHEGSLEIKNAETGGCEVTITLKTET